MGLEFVLGLVDKMSAPAKEAESALSSLERQIKSESESLSKLERSMANLQKGSSVDIGTQKSLSAAIASKKDSLAGLETKVIGLGDAEKGAATSSAGLSESLAGLGGPLGMITAVIGGVVAGLGALIVAGGAMAIAASDFKGDMIDAYEAIGGVKGEGEKTFKMIDDLAKQIPQPAAKVHEQAKKLMAQGLTDAEQLGSTLKAAADLQATLGDEAAAKLEGIVKKASTGGELKLDAKQLKDAGVTLDEVVQQMVKSTGKNAKQLEAELKAGTVKADVGIKALNAAVSQKYGGIAGKQLGDLDVMATKFKDNISRLFADVNPGPFLEGIGKVAAIFDDSTVTGDTMKKVITKSFDTIFAVGAKVFPYIKEAIQQVILSGLRIAIYMKPGVQILEKMFDTKSKGIELASVFKVIEFAVKAIAGAFLAGAIIVVGFFEMMSAGWDLASDAFTSAGSELSDLWDVFSDGVSNVTDVLDEIVTEVTGWWDQLTGIFGGSDAIGTSFVDGLIAGITGGAAAVVDSVKNLAGGAVSTAKSVLGIASPSAVMADIGQDTSAGFQGGVEAETPKAQGALEAMVAPPKVPAVAPPPLAGAMTGSGASSAPSAGPSLQNVTAPIVGQAPANQNGGAPLSGAVAPAIVETAAPHVNVNAAPVNVAPPSVNVATPTIAPPVASSPAVNVAAPSAPTGSSGGMRAEVTINIEGAGKSAEAILDLAEERMTSFFEKIAGQLGAEEAA